MSQQSEANAPTAAPPANTAASAVQVAAPTAADHPLQDNSIVDEGNQTNDTNIIAAALYINELEFFNALQDKGVEMSAEEKDKFLGNKKNKRGTIKRGDRFYKDIHDLANKLHKHYKDNFLKTLLPNMRKNDSEARHLLGRQLLEMRQTVGRADIHTVVTDTKQMDISRSHEFKDNAMLSFLSQTEWLKWIMSKWGKNEEKEKEMTNDDIVRAVGIMFMEDMREYIPYVLSDVDPSSKDPARSGNDPSRRLRLDSWNAKRNWTFRTLRDKFVDPDVVVEVNAEWKSDEARRRIDERLGFGEYDKLDYNPNNQERIKIPRTEKEVQTILGKGLIDYNKMMFFYKMNTGGGDGNPIVVAVWQDREPLDIVGYATRNNKEGVHLTIIHLWDKQYDFPLTIVKETGAPGGGVDDDDDDYIDLFTNDHHGNATDDDDGSSVATPTKVNSNKKTPKQSTTKKRSRSSSNKSSRGERDQLSAIARAQKQDRKEHLEQLSKVMKDVFQANGNNEGDKIDLQAKLQETIATTEAQLEKAEKDLKRLKRKRREAKEMAGNSPSNRAIKKRFDSVTAKATLAAKKVSAFQKTLENQLEQLQQLSGAGKKDGTDTDDGIDLSDVSDDSGSESD
eukprot:scaffold15868_cov67-Skeletonema_dohrnii-CCMP3373.AAC.2